MLAMHGYEDDLLAAIKTEIVKKKASLIRMRLLMKDLTIEESGIEMKYFLGEIVEIKTHDEMDECKKRQGWLAHT